jgi:hypothetical protein
MTDPPAFLSTRKQHPRPKGKREAQIHMAIATGQRLAWASKPEIRSLEPSAVRAGIDGIDMPKTDIGPIGLGVMGSNLILDMAEKSFKVAAIRPRRYQSQWGQGWSAGPPPLGCNRGADDRHAGT